MIFSPPPYYFYKGGSLLKMDTDQIRRKLINVDLFFQLFVLLGCLYLLIQTLSWPTRPRELPLRVLSLLAILLAVEIIQYFRREMPSTTQEDNGLEKSSHLKVLMMFLTLFIIYFLSFHIGLVFAVGLLSIIITILLGEKKWWVVLMMGALGMMVIYVLFGLGLGVSIY